jgi:hypothetical protein
MLVTVRIIGTGFIWVKGLTLLFHKRHTVRERERERERGKFWRGTNQAHETSVSCMELIQDPNSAQ